MKTVSIVENSDFKRAYYRGKNLASPLVVIYYRKNGRAFNRLGITTSKKIGNAVKRNRAKRVLRAAFSGLEEALKPGYDIILVARGKTPYVKSFDIYKEMYNLFDKASLFEEDAF